MLGNAVVEHPLAGDRALFLGVEGGRVVLEILDERAGLRTLIEDLGLAFVDLAAAGHGLDAPGQTKATVARPWAGPRRLGAVGGAWGRERGGRMVWDSGM